MLARDDDERAYLRTILIVTVGVLAFATAEGIAAWRAGSRDLLRDAFDWGYDVVIYGVALAAFGRGDWAEKAAALAIGAILVVAGLHTAYEMAEKIVTGREPELWAAGFSMLFAVAYAAIIVVLLMRFRHAANPLIAATWIATRNAAIQTVGLALGGFALKLWPSRGPDLATDLLAVFLNLQAGWAILAAVRRGERQQMV